MKERIAVCWYSASEFKERGFRGADAEKRAKALALKLLASPEVDDDGPARIDAVQVFLTSLDGQDTLGHFLFGDVELTGWVYADLDG